MKFSFQDPAIWMEIVPTNELRRRWARLKTFLKFVTRVLAKPVDLKLMALNSLLTLLSVIKFSEITTEKWFR